MNAHAIDPNVSAAGAMRLICAGADLNTIIRAERLQLRALDRGWADETLAALLRRMHQRLARVNGWGSAEQCPASTLAKTSADGDRDGCSAACNDLLPERATHGPAGASSEQSLRRARAGAIHGGTQ